MEDPIQNNIWVEKYRPSSLEEIALPEEDRKFLENQLTENTIPNLLLSGPAGRGKTSLAFIIEDRLSSEALVLNSSKERGIDVIRDKVTTYAQGLYGNTLNIVVLDEADGLTRDSQQALRNLMEVYSEQTRFILTANHPQKIIDPLRSRCHEIPLLTFDVKDKFKLLLSIVKEEDVDFELETVKAYAERYDDLRRMINAAQRSVLTHETLQPPVDVEGTVSLLTEAIHSSNWDVIVEISRSHVTDHVLLMQELFHAVDDSWDKPFKARYTIGKYVDESEQVPDAVVHFLGLCAYLIGD